MVAAQFEPGAVFAKDYRVVRPLDEGGMGAVYVVEQLSTGEQRALKVMQPHLITDQRTRERFLQEAKVRARIKSEHAVKVISAGVDEDTATPWMVMELLDGETLDTMVTRRGKLSPDEVCTVFEHIGHALAAAHSAGVVHRDIKPENIFVATSQRADVPFTVKLLDFGIAKVVKGSVPGATTGSLIGSPLWMSPEQCNGGRIRAATDVWALGLLAFWALTGEHYWKAAHNERTTIEQLLVEILISELDPASVRAASFNVSTPLAPGFDEWFARCLARPPEERFHDAADAVSALLPLLSNGRIRVTFPSIVTPAPGAEVARDAADAVRPTPARIPPAPVASGTGEELEFQATIPLRPSATTPTPQRHRAAYVVLPALFVSVFVVTYSVRWWRHTPAAPAPAPHVFAAPPTPPVQTTPLPTAPVPPTRAVADASVAPTPLRPTALHPTPAVVRPTIVRTAVPRAPGHTFQRRLDWDSICAAHRQRRAWAVAPTFATHADSESAAQSAGCVDIVGGIGWCCP